ncbi:putative VV A32 virion packaging ATPase [Mimivirus AB-566-O17]|uniref:Putative VV A32 virion packaging ATPase n=1 Tax=Mimivirus AB-566-O17 TaxID=1988039 RepID=A0A1X9VNW4_9VIRU|nr:putative VV A32 virion packaging ATPase [Mimivirus AB-566-O17]
MCIIIMPKKVGVQKIKLQKFDLDSLLNDSTVLILGRRRSGKSWLIRDLMYHKRFMKQVLVFSGTENVSAFMSDFVPDVFIHSEFSSEILENLLETQRKKIREAKRKNESEDGKTSKNNMAIVMDDMLHDAKSWTRDRGVKELFFNGRHYNLLYVVALQYVYGLPPEFRDNLDYIFIYPQENPQAKTHSFSL